jgi:hypothetical protein
MVVLLAANAVGEGRALVRAILQELVGQPFAPWISTRNRRKCSLGAGVELVDDRRNLVQL